MSLQQVISQIRDRVLELVDREPENIDQEDVEMITKSSDMIKRFMYNDEDFRVDERGRWDPHNVNMERVSRRIVRTLRWSKSFALNQLHSSHFPESFYRSKMLTYTLIQKKLTLYFRLSKFKKVSAEVSASFTAGAVYEINRLCHKFSTEYENGIIDLKPVIVTVMTGVRITQLDWKVFHNTLSIVSTHFPGCCHEYWLWGIPQYLHHIVRLFNKSLPPAIYAKTKLRNLQDAADLIGMDNIPRFLGGSSPVTPTNEVPDTFASMEEYADRFHIHPSDMKKVKQYFNDLLKDNDCLA